MSDVCYQNGDQSDHVSSSGSSGICELDSDTPVKCKNAFSDDTVDLPPHSPPLFYDDLLGDIPIYNMWLRKFGSDKNTADQGWKEFREEAIREYDALDKRLTNLGNDVDLNSFDDAFLDMKRILELKENVQAVFVELGDYEVEVDHLTKVFEQFSQYLPNGDHRKQVNEMIRNIQQRYFNILQDLDRKNETLLWVIPRLQRYKSSVSDFKTWLYSAESRSKNIVRNIDNCSFLIQNWECVQELVEELHVQKRNYEGLMEPGKGILGVDHQIKLNDLQVEIEEMEERWDLLCANMEKCVNKVVAEKLAAELQNKSEMEKIHIKIQQEIKRCTCFSPFRILKVDEGKYTFGTSKTVRLLRIHGSSVVVRVGGGWEYLYNFLLKVDPCRAKQHTTVSPNSNSKVDAVKLSALSLTPLNSKDLMLNVSVKRMRKSSLPHSNNRQNGTGKSSGISYSPASSGSPGTPKEKTIDEVNGERVDTTPKKGPNRRYSLMERQSLYAQKR